jgi:hypothetical protein
VASAWIVLLGLYYLLPVKRDSDATTALRLTVDLALVAVFLGWQTSRLARSELPELRAAQALGAFVRLFIGVFSSIHLSLSQSDSSNFSQTLDHTEALYFTTTVLSTVGFGDITPHTDPARIAVSIQMLLDLVIIGIVVRLRFGAAKTRIARGQP